MKNKLMILVILSFFVFYYLLKDQASQTLIPKSVKTALVSKRDLLQLKKFNGYILSSNRTILVSPMNGEIVWRLDSGVLIKKGDELLKFDAEVFDEKLEKLIEEGENKQSEIIELNSKTLTDVKNQNLLIQEESKKYDLELFKYKNMLDTPSKIERELQDTLVELQSLKKEDKYASFQTNKSLFAKGVMSKKVLQSSHISYKKASSELLKAKIVRNEKLKGVKPIILERQKKMVELQKNKHIDALKQKKENNKIQKLKLKRLQADLEIIERKKKSENLKKLKSIMVAPYDGIVVFPPVWKGGGKSTPIEVGEVTSKGTDLIHVSDFDKYDVQFYLPENEILYIDYADTFVFTAQVDSEIKVKGKVTYFSELTFDKNEKMGRLELEYAGESGIKVVVVKGLLEKSFKNIREGLTGDVEFKWERKGVVSVPLSFIKWDQEIAYVKTKNKKRVNVTLGIDDGFYVEILEGLNEGEVIIEDSE